MRIAICLVLTLAAASACSKKKEPEKKAEPTSTETATGSGSATANATGSGSATAASTGTGSAAGSGSATADNAGSAAGSGDASAMTHHAGNCPSTVADSTTKAEVKGKAIVVTITSDNKDAIPAIQKRTDELIKGRLGAKAGDSHDQRGTHGGRIGLCPLHIPEGATADAKHVAKGVAVTITPKDHVDDLKKEIDARIEKAAQWVKDNIKSDAKGNQGGTGSGKNNEGMNHSGSGDAKGMERKKGDGGGKGTGGGGGKGTGGGDKASRAPAKSKKADDPDMGGQ